MGLNTSRCEPEEKELTCRFCGSTLAEKYFVDREGDFIGCEYCVSKKEWYDTDPEDIA